MGIDSVSYGEAVRVRQQSKERQRRFLLLVIPPLISALMIAASLSFYLWTRVSVVTVGYDLSALKTTRVALIQKNRELRIQLDTMITPGELERIGKEMGLIYPEQDQIIPLR
ncbi:MAG: hypothetical protein JW885_15070 [Deltaproteobacteria bacterium]|nr:hypothetical protein [Candidatus Zymogenaceae bacterium]